MAKKKDEKDVLVVRDEKTGEISVVAKEVLDDMIEANKDFWPELK